MTWSVSVEILASFSTATRRPPSPLWSWTTKPKCTKEYTTRWVDGVDPLFYIVPSDVPTWSQSLTVTISPPPLRKESEMETEEEVDILMSSDVYSATLSTKSITFSRSQIGWLFREDKTVSSVDQTPKLRKTNQTRRLKIKMWSGLYRLVSKNDLQAFHQGFCESCLIGNSTFLSYKRLKVNPDTPTSH